MPVTTGVTVITALCQPPVYKWALRPGTSQLHLCPEDQTSFVNKCRSLLSAWELYGPISSSGGPPSADRGSEEGVTPWDWPAS